MTRTPLIAVVLIVALRLAIGWQLLYEGVWKLDTQDTARPWTAAGYLKNAEGPLRDTFRNMSGGPDDLGWLDYDVVAKRWDAWAAGFKTHYGFSDKQAKSLDRTLNGGYGKLGDRPVYASNELAKLPDGIDDLSAASRVSSKIAWYDAEKKLLYVDGKRHLTEAERDKLLNVVDGRDDEDSKAFRKAVEQVYARQKRGIGFKEKLAGALKGNPDLLGNEDWQRVGQKKEYAAQLARYEKLRDNAETDFQWDHLGSDWKKIQTLRAEITGPVKALEKELKESAAKQLTLAQMSLGQPPGPNTVLAWSDLATMWGLTILGVLLIAGLFTRFAAVSAAFMLFSFYLAMPPFPGVPEPPGPEHSLIVNKNLIEVIALLAIAALPTGLWFGVDSWIRGWRSAKANKATTP